MLPQIKERLYDLTLIAEKINEGKSFKLDMSKLPDYDTFHNSRRFELPQLGEVFSYLNSLQKQTCIYIWEASTNEDAKIIYKKYCDRKRKGIHCNQFGVRQTHAYGLKEYENSSTKTLYVGTRLAGYTKKWNLSNIEGRIIQHLGYYDKGSTHALQLRYWAGSYKLNLRIIELPDINKSHYQIFEKLIALHYKPLIGRH